MLLVGTARHLEDLDRQYTIAEDLSVTAIAVATDGQAVPATNPGAGLAYVLADGARVDRIEAFEVAPVAVLDGAAQSLAAAGGRLVVGTAGAHLLTVDRQSGAVAPVEAFERVDGREQWHNPDGSPPDLRSLAVSAAGTWLANVHVGGLWRSTDEGATWSAVIEPGADIHEVAAGSDGRLAVATARGLGWSDDDGKTWRWATEGLHGDYARAVALDGETAYVTASTGPSSTDGRLYRCRLGGPLAPCAGGLPESFPFNLDTGCVAARGGEAALGTRDGDVFRSSDGGDTFERVTERLPPVRVVRFA